MNKESVQITLVEDNPGDVELFKEALSSFEMKVSLRVARDGKEALELSGSQDAPNEYESMNLVLLDVNLPGINGHEVLSGLRSFARLKCTPMVMFTSSSNESDLKRAYEAGANSYVVKPASSTRFVEVVHEILHYWLFVSCSCRT